MQHFTIHLMILLWFGFTGVTSQLPEQSRTVNSRNSKRNFGLSETDDTAPQRFLTSANDAVVVSPLLLESHHDIVPTKSTRFTQIAVMPSQISHPSKNELDKLTTAIQSNPVLAALLINTLLGLNSGPQPMAYNTPEHQPPNPYIALLLSHYGRYIPRPGFFTHGLYGYTAANNIHNTRPFGSYKIYDDSA